MIKTIAKRVFSTLEDAELSTKVNEQTYISVTNDLKELYDYEDARNATETRATVIHFIVVDPEMVLFVPRDLNITCREFMEELLTRAQVECSDFSHWYPQFLNIYFSDAMLSGHGPPSLDTLRAMSETLFEVVCDVNPFMARLDASPVAKFDFFDPALLTFALRLRPRLIEHFFSNGEFSGTASELDLLLHFKNDELLSCERWEGSAESFLRVAYDAADAATRQQKPFRRALGIYGKTVVN
jgi:hypothetical protein